MEMIRLVAFGWCNGWLSGHLSLENRRVVHSLVVLFDFSEATNVCSTKCDLILSTAPAPPTDRWFSRWCQRVFERRPVSLFALQRIPCIYYYLCRLHRPFRIYSATKTQVKLMNCKTVGSHHTQSQKMSGGSLFNLNEFIFDHMVKWIWTLKINPFSVLYQCTEH